MFNKVLIRSLRTGKNYRLQSYYSTETVTAPKPSVGSFATDNVDPQQHSPQQLARFYKLPVADKNKIFHYGGIPKSFETQCKTFTETRLMVREPALRVINDIKATDLETSPMRRFVLYGKKGSGKSITMAHILHYGFKTGFLIVHVPWVGSWMRRCKEYSNSQSREGFVDLNLDAASWLIHFKTQNSHLLNNPELKTSVEYNWSKRETTPVNSPLTDVIEHGVNRIKYASECVRVICEEVKKLSNAGKCKTMVAIDGCNAFFYPNTRVYTEKKEMVPPSKVTLTEGFLTLLRPDWKNGIAVVTVDEIANAEEDQLSYLPRYLLGKTGFELLDPFIPVLVPQYTEKEFLSCMDYYKERKWVQDMTGLNDELKFLSNMNPYKLMRLCSAL